MLKNLGVWLLPVFFIIAGCSSDGRPERAPVSGVVLYQGRPVPDAVVTFIPRAGGRYGTATTDEEGRFEVTTLELGDGALVGEHTVTISPYNPGVELAEHPDSAAAYAPPSANAKTTEIPAKYQDPDASPLLYTVAPGRNEFTIELRD